MPPVRYTASVETIADGGIMRARREVYPALAGERSARSGCPFHEGGRRTAG